MNKYHKHPKSEKRHNGQYHQHHQHQHQHQTKTTSFESNSNHHHYQPQRNNKYSYPPKYSYHDARHAAYLANYNHENYKEIVNIASLQFVPSVDNQEKKGSLDATTNTNSTKVEKDAELEQCLSTIYTRIDFVLNNNAKHVRHAAEIIKERSISQSWRRTDTVSGNNKYDQN